MSGRTPNSQPPTPNRTSTGRGRPRYLQPARTTFGSWKLGVGSCLAALLIAFAPVLSGQEAVPPADASAWTTARPIFRLLGARDVGTSDDYNREKMPPVGVALLGGHLAWRQHEGGHADGPNWKYFIPGAERFLGR